MTDNYLQSIFGMNVMSPLFPQLSTGKGPSRDPSPTATNSSAHTKTSTQSATLTRTGDSSGPSQHYWTMYQYLGISLPLTIAVILLPLIAGPCFRSVSQQYEVHRRHWRAFFVVLVILYFVGVVCLSTLVVYLRYSSYNDDKNDSFFWEYANLIWCYTVPGMICLVCLVRAFKQRQGRLRWSLQLLIYTMCLVFEIVWTNAIIWTIPWAPVSFLSMVLTSQMGVEWLKRGWTWLSWKTERQSATRYSSVTTV